VTRKKL
jgi:carbohydrate ABC transporter substrate-binding protein, CUT1 family (TC 3.A.1.1.-)